MKKIKLSQKQWNVIDSIILAIGAFIVMALLYACTPQERSYQRIDKAELRYLQLMEQKAVHYEQLCIKLHDVLHEVWLDKPNYVEEGLMEYDMFIELDSLEDGWGNTFTFRDSTERQRYNWNWEHETE